MWLLCIQCRSHLPRDLCTCILMHSDSPKANPYAEEWKMWVINQKHWGICTDGCYANEALSTQRSSALLAGVAMKSACVYPANSLFYWTLGFRDYTVRFPRLRDSKVPQPHPLAYLGLFTVHCVPWRQSHQIWQPVSTIFFLVVKEKWTWEPLIFASGSRCTKFYFSHFHNKEAKCILGAVVSWQDIKHPDP